MNNITIILAAGKNTRIEDICFDAPKGMLSINGQGIVERLCLQFAPFSQKIIVVAGNNIMSYQYLESKIKNVIIVGTINKQHISNSESLLVGLNSIHGELDTVTIVEGDIVLSNASIKMFFNNQNQNKFIATNELLTESDDKIFYDYINHCYFIDKSSTLYSKNNSLKTIGKFLGVATFPQKALKNLKNVLKSNIEAPYVNAIQTYLNDSCKVIEIDKEQGFEIDTSIDYYKALTNYKITRVESSSTVTLNFSNKILYYNGVYDVFGGLVAQRLGFDGLWLGSYQISLSNGVKDDETFNPLISLKLAKKLKQNLVQLPIIIDLGSGFQSETDLDFFTKEVKHTNIVAVCIDDHNGTRINSMFDEGKRQILNAKEFLRRISDLRQKLPSEIKIIARTETLTVYKYKIEIEKLKKRIKLLQNDCVDAILPHYVGNDFSYLKDIMKSVSSKKPIIIIPTGLMNVSKKDFSKLGINLIVYANIDIRVRFRFIKDIYSSLITTGKLNDSYLALLASPLEIKNIIELED